MTREPTEWAQQPAYGAEALVSFYAPQLVLLAAAVLRIGPLSIALLLLLPWSIQPRWLLLNWVAMSLINFPTYVPDVGWVGLLPTYYTALVVAARFGLLGRLRLGHRDRLELVALATIALSFVTLSLSAFFTLTGIKSSLQLGFLLILAVLLRRLSPDQWRDLASQVSRFLPLHLCLYVLAGLYVWRYAPALPNADFMPLFDDTKPRFNGLCGAQVCAFAFTSLLAFFWVRSQKLQSIGCIAVIALTGSRTYVGAAAVVLMMPTLMGKMRARTRLFLIVLVVALIGVSVFVLPMLSDRFVMNDEFYGSLLGRFLNYDNAVEHIRGAPIFGEGMGAMLQVLQDWSPLAFDQYRAAGDTTIMHNEYLRIAMETGALGFSIAFLLIWQAWRRQTVGARAVALTFLIGSLTENTLAGYSTGMLLMFLVWNALAHHSAPHEVTCASAS